MMDNWSRQPVDLSELSSRIPLLERSNRERFFHIDEKNILPEDRCCSRTRALPFMPRDILTQDLYSTNCIGQNFAS